MTLEILTLESEKEVDESDLLEHYNFSSPSLFKPFEDHLIDFCNDFSKAIFKDNRIKKFHDIQALAYWLRRSNLMNLKKDFFKSSEGTRTSRGLCFHIAPKNVETIFIYSWICSFLVGNKNIVRVSQQQSKNLEILLEIIKKLFRVKVYANISESNLVVNYGHNDKFNSFFSKLADVRAIWGGDQTIQNIQRFQLRPQGKDLKFYDRFSMAAINSKEFLALELEDRKNLTSRFFSDAYLFDQLACSSPRLAIFVGEENNNKKAKVDFFQLLKNEIIQRKFKISTSLLMKKLTFLYKKSAQGFIKDINFLSNELIVSEVEDLTNFDRENIGSGIFYVINLKRINELENIVVKKDQTLSYFGFTKNEIENLVTCLNGRGIDRIVPIGQALQFDVNWDGMNLLEEFSKRTYFI
ncbi:hypothetical protein OAK75_00155 [Bacteriovoracales bacterium]|nr:hypothetical protein [Bacteriovoracales bacterium]